MNCDPTETPDDIDVPTLRAKYRQERDKRLRSERTLQYVEAANDLADYYETDSHSPRVVREPISDDIDVAVLGGGYLPITTTRAPDSRDHRCSASHLDLEGACDETE